MGTGCGRPPAAILGLGCERCAPRRGHRSEAGDDHRAERTEGYRRQPPLPLPLQPNRPIVPGTLQPLAYDAQAAEQLAPQRNRQRYAAQKVHG